MSTLADKKTKISIAHSPDADDAFMFYALTEGLIKENDFEIENVLKDIQTLNVEAKTQKYDVQAISFHAYPELQENYQLLSCGGSLGYGYGPMIISKEKVDFETFSKQGKKKIAIPGEKTTAYLLLQLLHDDFEPVSVPFDEIIDVVSKGEIPYGLIIHEGQISYERHGLNKVIDLGEWWLGLTNLPVPLGGNVVKRNLPEDVKKKINLIIKKSIVYGLENKKGVVPEVTKYARELENDNTLVDKFVRMYVNDYTVDYGDDGRLAIKKLFQMAVDKGLVAEMPNLDFIS